jgi:hypothetical protein
MSVFPKAGCILAVVFTSIVAGSAAAAPAPTPRCTAYSTATWAASATVRLKLEAFSDGPTCAKSVAVFVVRDSAGTVLYSESHQSEFVMSLAGARNRQQMQAALSDWVRVGKGANFTANLPNWVSGATAPVETEFGFMPNDGITRADYLAVKTSRAPLLCYVQGMESLRCLVYRNNGLEDFGIQSFPG